MAELSVQVDGLGANNGTGFQPGDNRQSGGGFRSGYLGNEAFCFATDRALTWPDGAVIPTPGLVNAVLWGGSTDRFDTRLGRITIFVLRSDPTLYWCYEQDLSEIAIAHDLARLEYMRGAGWYSPRIRPPSDVVPPTVIDTGPGDIPGDDEYLVRTLGSNPYTIQAGWQGDTRTLSEYFYGNGADHSQTADPGDPFSGIVYAANYHDGTIWYSSNFNAHAEAGDHWPLLAYTDPAMNFNSMDNADKWDDAFVWWPRWNGGTFRTISFSDGVSTRFADDALWDSVGVMSTKLASNQRARYTDPPFSIPKSIEERVIIRGTIYLPLLPTGATCTHIQFNAFTNHDFWRDGMYLNDGSIALPGPAPGARIPGFFSDDMSGTNHRGVGGWNFQTDPFDVSTGRNLFVLRVTGLYALPSNPHGYPENYDAVSWIGIVFSIDEGAGPYRTPPPDWQNGNGGEVYAPPNKDLPPSFFGRGTSNQVTFPAPGDSAQLFYRRVFNLAAAPTTATLNISAKDAILGIWINGTLIYTGPDTAHLYATGTTLSFSPPVGLFRVGVNRLAVEIFNDTGDAHLIYKLLIR